MLISGAIPTGVLKIHLQGGRIHIFFRSLLPLTLIAFEILTLIASP
jgi:hypothetical protein